MLRLFKLLKLLRMARLNQTIKRTELRAMFESNQTHAFGRFVLVLNTFHETLEANVERTDVAGRDEAQVRKYLREAAECLHKVAETKRIHGNVSPTSFGLARKRASRTSCACCKNRHNSDEQPELLLLDFDHSVQHGKDVSKCATATAPPEQLRLEIDLAMGKRKEFLRRVKLLKGMNDRDLSQLAEALETISFTYGQEIITQGDTVADHFYIIEKGTVAVEIDGRHAVHRYDGAYFG